MFGWLPTVELVAPSSHRMDFALSLAAFQQLDKPASAYMGRSSQCKGLRPLLRAGN